MQRLARSEGGPQREFLNCFAKSLIYFRGLSCVCYSFIARMHLLANSSHAAESVRRLLLMSRTRTRSDPTSPTCAALKTVFSARMSRAVVLSTSQYVAGRVDEQVLFDQLAPSVRASVDGSKKRAAAASRAWSRKGNASGPPIAPRSSGID